MKWTYYKGNYISIFQNSLFLGRHHHIRSELEPGRQKKAWGCCLRCRCHHIVDRVALVVDNAAERLAHVERDRFWLLLALQAAGIRGWFNPRTGRILVPANFNQDDPHDAVALHGMLARALLAQHAPTAIGRLEDDEWLARRAFSNAVAGMVESELRRTNPEPFQLPQQFSSQASATRE